MSSTSAVQPQSPVQQPTGPEAKKQVKSDKSTEIARNILDKAKFTGPTQTQEVHHTFSKDVPKKDK